MPATQLDPAAILDLAQRICGGEELADAQALELLELREGPAFAALLQAACQVRDRFVGRTLRVCSILNVKAGNCSEDCGYCAQAKGSTADGYEKTKWLPDEEIAAAVDSSLANGAQALGLVAAWKGVKEGAQLEMVVQAIEKFAASGRIRPDVTLGILESQRCADRIAAAGARVYNHNLETARSHYGAVVGSHSFEDRLRTVKYIKQAGMELCSGGIVGMGESAAQRVEFLAQLRFIQPDMVPVNFLNPIPGIRLQDLPLMPPAEALNFLAVARLYLADRNLMVAGGKEAVFGERLHEVLGAGVNALMVGNYLTTLGTGPDYWREAAVRYGLVFPSGCGCGG